MAAGRRMTVVPPGSWAARSWATAARTSRREQVGQVEGMGTSSLTGSSSKPSAELWLTSRTRSSSA